MTKPWWGVTPPPRGQGYYVNEEGFERFENPSTISNNTPSNEKLAVEWLRSLGYTVSKNQEEK